MNREIKFRFWLSNIKKMTYEHKLSEIGKIIPEFTDDIIPLQYTGLRDKNGKGIYEGDILKDSEQTYIVKFGELDNNEGLYPFIGFYLEHLIHRDYDGPFSSDDQNVIEVIGNIYENPNLVI
jgi:uncharacterized phage protein (TIGR01671 family)